MERVRVLIVDDQCLICEGLRYLLEKEDCLEVVAMAQSGTECLEQVEKFPVDLVYMDIEMPGMDGIATTKQLMKAHPSIKVLALTMIEETDTIVDMMEAGASGYLLKDSPRQELVEAALAVTRGGVYFCSQAKPRVLKRLATSQLPILPLGEAHTFTEQEHKIIELICREYSTKQIGPEMGLTPKTVEHYRVRILKKIGAQNTAGIVVYAIRHGLFSL
jgi:DNA-binding NarL/FixJ family response regulator